MSRRLLLGSVLALCAGAAQASDKLVIAPPPSWVIALPTPVPPAAKAQGPGRALLEDFQVRILRDGEDIYRHNAAQILTTQGLAAGNLQFAWNPATETLIVHHVHIIRGGQVIDVLAQGQSFTVLRRESNLERAMLDGRLTAVIQPEGLEVGDVIDIALTLQRRDPTMRGHSEFSAGLNPAWKISRLYQRVVAPRQKPVRLRQTEGLNAPVVSQTTLGTESIIDMTDVQAPKPPAEAPRRYNDTGQLEVSDFASWAEVSSLFAPLFQKAATLSAKSPLKAEAAKIAARTTDPKARADAALALVEGRVRYLFLGMNLGGYTPADADTTWTRRFGDCKGKTVLLLALLHELGIEAEPALVSTTLGDGLDARLPLVEVFDHVIVRTRIGGKTYWLDGTRTGDKDVDRLTVPPYFWALPVRATGGGLEKLTVAPFEHPTNEFDIRIDASGGLWSPAPIHIEQILRGDEALEIRQLFAALPAEEADKALRQSWTEKYSWIEVKKVELIPDEATGETRIVMDGSASMAWSRSRATHTVRYETDGLDLGWRSSFEREAGPHPEAPFKVRYPHYTKTVETIILPDGGAGFTVTNENVDRTVGGWTFKRTTSIDNKGVFHGEASVQAIAPEVPAETAAKAKIELRDMESVTVYVEAPKYWRVTDQQRDVRIARKPETAKEFADRGLALFDRGQYDKAMLDFAEAIRLKPETSEAWNDRCFVRAEANRSLDEALADCNEALRLEPKAWNFMDSRGLAYFRLGKLDEALRDYDAALTLNPELASSLFMRGLTKQRMGKAVEGSTDIVAALAIDPQVADEYAKYGIKVTRIDLPAGAKVTR
jgi:tetratricopeptide (TPR) repeat protein/transglutaminase-like putative cysteine protease